jgi:threonine/homoserine/homoserine lactone efflux protein
VKRLGDVAVGDLEDPRPLVDERHVEPQRGGHRGVLEADHAASDHGHGLRQVGEAERVVRVEHGAAVQLDSGGPCRPRADGDHDTRAREAPRAPVLHDLEHYLRVGATGIFRPVADARDGLDDPSGGYARPVGHLLPFLAASILITIVPGADMALLTRQVIAGGRPRARRTIAGNLSGLVVHGSAAAVGVSAILVASAGAFTVVKTVGAAYLIWLGIGSLRAARRAHRPLNDPFAPPIRTSRGNPFVQGFVSTVLNPKPALFFLTFVPQFIDPHGVVWAQALGLTAIHIAVGAVWLTIYAELVGRLAGTLSRPRVRATLEGLTGTVLIALGLRVAIERR